VSGALKDFQRRMAAAVMAPLTARGTMVRRRPDGLRTEAEAAAWVKPNDRLSAFERLEIYNRQYWLRVLGSLAEDYPGLRAVLGGARFDRMARAYLAQCPSRSFTLRDLGSRLPQWLEENPHGPLALAMARLEWAHIEAFDEAALPLPGPGQLEAVDGSTRLRLQPHVRLLHLAYPVDDLLIRIRRKLRDRDTGGNSAVLAGHPAVRRAAALEPAEIFLAVHRHDQCVYYKRLEPEAWRILEAIQSGAALAEALAAGFQGSALAEPERPAFLRRAFHDWAGFGWFALGGSHE